MALSNEWMDDIDPDGLPRIVINDRFERDVIVDYWGAISDYNSADWFLFRMGGRLVYIGENDQGVPLIEEVSGPGLRSLIDQLANNVYMSSRLLK